MNAATRKSWPAVSVIMPVRNEERHLAESVARVLDQEYPGEMEVVLAVGPSADRTADIAAELASDSRVRVIDNPEGRTPTGLNAAIDVARNDIIVRVDGHGLLSPGYIRRAVEVLQETGAANVGGIMRAEGQSDFERAVARAMTSPLGIGGARFHLGGNAGRTDTVYLGVFRREVLRRLGGYDEHFVRAQDWELNYRIRRAGEVVWFTPDLVVTYRPRSTLRELGKQFFCSGQWRREVIRRYPETTNLRYVAAPAAAVAILGGSVAGLVGALASTSWLLAGWLAPAGYAAGIVGASVVIGRGLPARARWWLPAVLATMHLGWGAGFLVGPRPSSRSNGRQLSTAVEPAAR